MRIFKAAYHVFLRLTESLSRIQLRALLNPLFKTLPVGKVLEIGAGKYPLYKDKFMSLTYQTLDIRAEAEPDICADVHNMPIEDGVCDVVFATEVLEHFHTPQKAIDEIYRILKKGGVCILSTRFMYKIHSAPYDYYRFTDQGLAHLFERFSEKEIKGHGNAVTVFIDYFYRFEFPLRALFVLNYIIKAIFFGKSRKCPSGYVVYAKK